MATQGEAVGHLTIGGTPYEVRSFHGTEALSTLFRFDLVLELPMPLPALRSWVGASCELSLRTEHGVEKKVVGIVAAASAIATDASTARADVQLRPSVFALTEGRDCDSFQEMSVIDVGRDVLSSYGGPIRWSLSKSYAKSPYRVQYREDDWTYIARLFEEEGIYTWFDDDGTLVVADDSRVAEDIPGGGVLEVLHDQGFEAQRDAILELRSTASSASGRFTVRSFDPERPALDIAGSTGAVGPEIYDAPGAGPRDPAGAAARALLLAERSKAARSGVAGRTSTIRLVPGRAITVVGHPLARFDQRYLITSVATAMTDQKKLEVVFEAIPIDVPFRPQPMTPDARQPGLQLGQVIGPAGQEVHPDPLGRIRVQMHWDRLGARDEKAGTWTRVAQRGAPGSMLLPRMGWNVATFNEEGGVDAPSLVCRIHDAEHPPTYALPANKTRVVFKTATTPGGGSFNEIYFEDKKGAEEMFIRASRDMNLLTKHVKTENVGNDLTRRIGNVRELSVDDSVSEVVHGNQVRTIGVDQKLEVQGERMKMVDANDTSTVGGSRTLRVGDSHNLGAQKNRTMTAPVVIDLTLGDISSRGKDGLLMVGGLLLRATAMSSAEDAGKVSLQAVGGAKIEICKKLHGIGADKSLTEAVGGLISLKAGGKFMDAAEKTGTWKAGMKLEGKAPKLHVEAAKAIRIKCGESVLTLTETTISLESVEIAHKGKKLDADTKAITHN